MTTSPPADESPTRIVDQLRQGEEAAAQKLWQIYFEKLVRLAGARMRAGDRRVRDEEDVALSAFHSFCRGIENGRFPQIASRDDLWRLLVSITLHKASHAVRDGQRLKRGGGWNQIDAVGSDLSPLAQLVSHEPTPEFAAQVAEQVEHLLACLQDETLVRVAIWKMEGYSNEEIAGRLNVAERTVERKLKLIRAAWEEDVVEDNGSSSA
jgi:DNA-directed RNA polymerase specialized sigma24 family protein